jgi:hypothetical protein
LVGVLWVGEAAGTSGTSTGDAALLAGAFFISLVVGLVASSLSLSSLVPDLRQHGSCGRQQTSSARGCPVHSLSVCAVTLMFGFFKILLS